MTKPVPYTSTDRPVSNYRSTYSSEHLGTTPVSMASLQKQGKNLVQVLRCYHFLKLAVTGTGVAWYISPVCALSSLSPI